MANKPKSPIDDIAKLLAKAGVKLNKKQKLDMKRYARGMGRTNYLDKKPNTNKPKTPAQKRVAPRLEMIEDRRQDKVSRMYGDNDGPLSYFMSDKNLTRTQKKQFNSAFSKEAKIGADNARKVQKSLSSKTAAKKAPVKKAPAPKAPKNVKGK